MEATTSQNMVLSLDPDHLRHYDEGMADRDYLATDKLPSEVPDGFGDGRLKAKGGDLAPRFEDAPGQALAIASDILMKTPVDQRTVGKQDFLVSTDSSWAPRVCESSGVEFPPPAISLTFS